MGSGSWQGDFADSCRLTAAFLMNKIESANQLNTFLGGVVRYAGLKLKYRIMVDPPFSEDRDWEHPEILVEFAGPDSSLLLERGAELLRSMELLAMEMLHLPGNEHEKINFDCMRPQCFEGLFYNHYHTLRGHESCTAEFLRNHFFGDRAKDLVMRAGTHEESKYAGFNFIFECLEMLEMGFFLCTEQRKFAERFCGCGTGKFFGNQEIACVSIDLYHVSCRR